ncbi:protein PHLOEM PROTEIN 2-LIKE A1-like [Syzygium oleosum]|uniref:protein PHLOEM PROTEIN 2-LIKE A1-like n=1 Tax=Syzygium oleosum TaxID=219896 RepID=UPI0024B8FB77|nr:protein PHLOEM PROTEIN 2-LIKE A1-like [Syzygium oleosum]
MAQQSWAMSKYRQIGFLMEAGQDVDPNEYQNNPERIDKLLSAGVDYKDKKKRYWVDKGHDCFAIYARGLNITNSDRPVYWQWLTDSDGIEMAKVVKTRWLEVRGSFWTMNLSPNVPYKVSFRTRIDNTPYSTMNGQSVNLRLTLPDGTYQERQAELPGKKLQDNDPWYELEVGQFNMTAQNVGKMEFAMEQLFGRWRAGLVIKSVQIKTM